MSLESEREYVRAELEQRRMELAHILGIVCVGCGCTQDDACPGGCFWVAFHEDTGDGICSTCVGVPILDLVQRRLIV